MKAGDLTSLLIGLELLLSDGVVELAFLSAPGKDPMLSSEVKEYLLFSPSRLGFPELVGAAEGNDVVA